MELFHTHDYVEQIKQQSKFGLGYLDQGDTPALSECMKQPQRLQVRSVMQ